MLPAAPKASKCRLTNAGQLTSLGTSGLHEVHLKLFDKFNNHINKPNDRVMSMVTASVDDRPCVVRRLGGVVCAVIDLGTCPAGDHIFTISVGGEVVPGCPKTFIVRPTISMEVGGSLMSQLRQLRTYTQMIVRVRRGQHLFQDAFQTFMSPGASLRGELRVVFRGESGIDEGGLAR